MLGPPPSILTLSMKNYYDNGLKLKLSLACFPRHIAHLMSLKHQISKKKVTIIIVAGGKSYIIIVARGNAPKKLIVALSYKAVAQANFPKKLIVAPELFGGEK